jgi:hypothetical protein
MVGLYPAIAYIADNGNDDEWRYIMATDVNGATWGTYVIIESSTADITFSPVSLFLCMVGGNPTIFLNNEYGRAQMYRASNATGSAWETAINISNLTNHQILDVQIINGLPAVIAKSNVNNHVYFVRALTALGTAWPVGATQLYKQGGAPLLSNNGKGSSYIGMINNILSVVISEANTNNLLITNADINGASWSHATYLTSTNTATAYPKIFQNNSTTYLIYNNSTGSPSEKKLIEFKKTGGIAKNSTFINTLSLCGDNQIISNKNDGNNFIIMASEKKLSLIKFYGNDLVINWVAMA